MIKKKQNNQNHHVILRLFFFKFLKRKKKKKKKIIQNIYIFTIKSPENFLKRDMHPPFLKYATKVKLSTGA
jgi:hypothetical protein